MSVKLQKGAVGGWELYLQLPTMWSLYLSANDKDAAQEERKLLGHDTSINFQLKGKLYGHTPQR